MFFKNESPLNKYDNVYIDMSGYLRSAISNRLIHHEIMEIELDRKLKWWEVVHHIDGDKMNNDANNLWVCRRCKGFKINQTSFVRKRSLA